MSLLVTKPINLAQLLTEIQAAGIALTAIGTDAQNDLITYDAQGHPEDVPAGCAAVLAAHVPVFPKTADQIEADAIALMQAATTIADMKAAVLAYMQARKGVHI